jgi:hypothetical protein
MVQQQALPPQPMLAEAMDIEQQAAILEQAAKLNQ